jgi:hypothetical protein
MNFKWTAIAELEMQVTSENIFFALLFVFMVYSVIFESIAGGMWSRKRVCGEGR